LSSNASWNIVLKQEVLEEKAVLEDEEFAQTMVDQRGDTKHTYQVLQTPFATFCLSFVPSR